MAEFYSARGWEIPPLPWTNLSPPFSAGRACDPVAPLGHSGGSSVDASVDASISLNVSGHVVRCGHLSGLMMRLV